MTSYHYFLFSVSWNVRGTIIRDGDNDKYEVTPEGLVIKDVSQEDKGAYKCKAIQLDEDITDFQDMIIDLRVQRKFEKKIMKIRNEGLFVILPRPSL